MIHLLTGEYPPHKGGVGDYSALIAAKLASAGECVHVWTRGHEGTTCEDGVVVHRVAGGFAALDLAMLDQELNTLPAPHRIVVQWTPHSYGWKSLNLQLTAWLWKRARINRDRIELMVHEPFLAFARGKWKLNIAAVVHRAMIAMLLDGAVKVWIAIPAWENCLRPWCFGKFREFTWLPVPSNIDEDCQARGALRVRNAFAPRREPIVGHFGTYREDVAALLQPAVEQLLLKSNSIILLTGFGSEAFAERFDDPRVHATGTLRPLSLAEHLSACDVLLQPYPDGVSTRRGSTMAALALGIPMITNLGHLSEEFWPESGAVRLALSTTGEDLSASTLQLIEDRDLRLLTSSLARELYRERFSVQRTINALLGREATNPVKSMVRAVA